MGDITGSKKAAKQQADATMTAANLTAQNDRFAVQASQQQTETMLAQDKAAQAAATLLNIPTPQVDVSLGSNAQDGTTIDSSGKRRTARSKFTTASRSGINI